MRVSLSLGTLVAGMALLLVGAPRIAAEQSQVKALNRPRIGDRAIAAGYNWWGLSGVLSPDGPGAATIRPSSVQVELADGTPYEPFRAPLLITVADSTHPAETVIAVPSGCSRQATCVLQVTLTGTHAPAVRLGSGTGGLQEAIQDMGANGGVVVITDAWGPAAAALPPVQLPAHVLLEDQRGGNLTYYRGGADHQARLLWSARGDSGEVAAPNFDSVRFCDQFPGTDAGAQINNCIADLPPAGGVADARGLQGQLTAAATIAVGSETKPVALLLGALTLQSAANPALLVAGASSVRGLGGSTLSSGSGSGPFSQIVATAPGATAVDFHGMHGGLSGLGLSSDSGDVIDMITTATDAAVGVSLDDNSFTDLSLHCNQQSSHDALLLSEYNETSLIQYNAFQNLRIYGCLNSIHLTTTAGGSVGPADNQWYGGQVTKAERTGTGIYLDANSAGNTFNSMDVAGLSVGTHIVATAFANSFYGTQFESNTSDVVIDTGSSDNAFFGGGGVDAVQDNGTRTVFLGGNYTGGPNGSNLNQIPTPLRQLGINSPQGQATQLASAATTARTDTFPDRSGTVALTGTAQPLLSSGSFGSGSTTNTDSVGAVVLADGAGTYRFAASYTIAPVCFAQDQTAPGTPVTITVSNIAISFAGSGGDTIGYGCFTRQ